MCAKKILKSFFPVARAQPKKNQNKTLALFSTTFHIGFVTVHHLFALHCHRKMKALNAFNTFPNSQNKPHFYVM